MYQVGNNKKVKFIVGLFRYIYSLVIYQNALPDSDV